METLDDIDLIDLAWVFDMAKLMLRQQKMATADRMLELAELRAKIERIANEKREDV